MIKLTVKLLLFISILLVFSNICSYVALKSPFLINILDAHKSVEWVYSAIDKSNKPVTSDVIILGDSVAKQIFKPGDYNFIISAPATIVGQYILLNNILYNNKNIKLVVMICYPGSLRMKFDGTYTYNHFIRPFYKNDNMQVLSDTTEAYIKHHRYYYLYKLPMAKVLPVFSLIDCSQSSPDKPDEYYEYSIFIEYMTRIIELCNKNHVEFKIVPPPVSNSHNNSFDFDKLRRIISVNGYDNQFSCYFDTLIVKDDMYYKDDHWHYKNQYEDEMSKVFREKANNCVGLPII
jgi:hypothetical protein